MTYRMDPTDLQPDYGSEVISHPRVLATNPKSLRLMSMSAADKPSVFLSTLKLTF